MSEGKKFFGTDWQSVNDALNAAILAVQAIELPASHTPAIDTEPPYSGVSSEGPSPIPRGVLERWDMESEEAVCIIGGEEVPGFTMPLVSGGSWTDEIPPDWLPLVEFDAAILLLQETSSLWWADDFRTWWFGHEVPLASDYASTRRAVSAALAAIGEAANAVRTIHPLADHGKNWKV